MQRGERRRRRQSDYDLNRGLSVFIGDITATDDSSIDNADSGSAGTQATDFHLSDGELEQQPRTKRRRREDRHREMPATEDQMVQCDEEIHRMSYGAATQNVSASNNLTSWKRQNATNECPSRMGSYAENTAAAVVVESMYCDSEAERESELHSEDSNVAQEPLKTIEARRLCRILDIIERGKLPRRYAERLMNTRVINSRYSYKALIGHLKTRSGILTFEKIMCRHEHAAISPRSASCPVPYCNEKPNRGHLFHYRLVSDQISALCRETVSFKQLFEGCMRANRAVSESIPTTFFDYFDGDLFRRLYGEQLRVWDEREELYVFITLSTDGFEVFKGRRKTRTAWPIVFSVLNFDFDHRYRASNSIISAFLPGTHEPEFFDSFISEVIEDLKSLESGVQVQCADGRLRNVKVFVVFCTADWPASSKLLGFVPHNGLTSCRRCHKRGEYVPELGSVYFLPSGGANLRNGVISGKTANLTIWKELECPEPRTDIETRQVWPKIAKIKKQKNRGWKQALKSISQETGIKRKPVVSELSIDMVESVPYDPMHLVLSGWVGLLIRLTFSLHPRSSSSNSPQYVDVQMMHHMNKHLEKGSVGLPEKWGRPPLSLEFFSNFKVEDLKCFALYFAPVLLSHDNINHGISRIWVITSEIVAIVFDPTPSREEANRLESLTLQAHAMLCKLFWHDTRSSFCLPPNTHALLHLGEIMRQCGPLTNISQFTVERFVGEIGPSAKSRVKPETNMFNKTNNLFCLRLLNGGVGMIDLCENLCSDDSVRNQQSQSSSPNVFGNVRFFGLSTLLKDRRRIQKAEACARSYFGEQYLVLDVISVTSFEKCFINSHLTVETEKALKRRLRTTEGARQKCWIAAQFEVNEAKRSDEMNDSDLDDSGSYHDGTPFLPHSRQTKTNAIEVYYGRVHDIWKTSVSYKDVESNEQHQIILPMVEIDWMYGLARDKRSGTIYTNLRRGKHSRSIKNIYRTTEITACIDRLIAYFDYSDCRFFLDTKVRQLDVLKSYTLKGMA